MVKQEVVIGLATVDHCGHKKFKTFPKKYWPKWSDQTIECIFKIF